MCGCDGPCHHSHQEAAIERKTVSIQEINRLITLKESEITLRREQIQQLTIARELIARS